VAVDLTPPPPPISTCVADQYAGTPPALAELDAVTVRVGARLRSLSPAVTAVGLGALTAGLRLPLRGSTLFNWDSLQFALGIQRFDVAAHRPHPPGYIGYIAMGRVLNAAGLGPTSNSLVLLSIAAEALTVALVYLLARRLMGGFAGVAAALLLMFSPLYWLYGETALTYALDPLLALAAAWPALRYLRGRGSPVPVLVAAGLAGAVRPSAEVFLAPLVVAVLWQCARHRQGRHLRLALAAGVLTNALWMVPLLVLSGGPLAYLRDSLQLGEQVSQGTALWRAGVPGLVTNVGAVINGLGLMLVLYLPLGAAGALLGVLPSRMRPRGMARFSPAAIRWAALWAVLPLLTWLLVHIGQVAYVLFLAPLLVLPAGLLLDRLARAVAGRSEVWRRRLRVSLLAACCGSQMALFLVPSDSLAAMPAARDRHVAALTAWVRETLPADALLIAQPEGPGSYRVAMYYLPEHPAVAIGRDRFGRAGQLWSDAGGAPEYDLSRFGRVAPPAFPRLGEAAILDADAAAVIGDKQRLHLAFLDDGQQSPVYRLTLTPGDPPRAFGGFLYVRGSDCPCSRAAPRGVPAARML
jgi:hypothetical protein